MQVTGYCRFDKLTNTNQSDIVPRPQDDVGSPLTSNHLSPITNHAASPLPSLRATLETRPAAQTKILFLLAPFGKRTVDNRTGSCRVHAYVPPWHRLALGAPLLGKREI